jgi:hypothetical protein
VKQRDKIFMGIGASVVATLAVVTGVSIFSTSGKNTGGTVSTASDVTTSTSEGSASSSTDSSTSTYSDGTYAAATSYAVPEGGQSSISTKLTLQNGVVTSVTVTGEAGDNESGMYIDSFENAIKDAVVGKAIGDLSLSRIGGASLTTQAFNDALATIRNDAKA